MGARRRRSLGRSSTADRGHDRARRRYALSWCTSLDGLHRRPRGAGHIRASYPPEARPGRDMRVGWKAQPHNRRCSWFSSMRFRACAVVPRLFTRPGHSLDLNVHNAPEQGVDRAEKRRCTFNRRGGSR
jgi:hypothetical protein